MFGRFSAKARQEQRKRTEHAEMIVDLLNTGYLHDAQFEARRFADTYGTVFLTEEQRTVWDSRRNRRSA